MAARKRTVEVNPVVDKLDAIHAALQELFILQARLAGMKKASVRAIVGVADARVTRIWREVGGGNDE